MNRVVDNVPFYKKVINYTKSQIILIRQNLGSKPKINCKIITDKIIITGFLYFIIVSFIV